MTDLNWIFDKVCGSNCFQLLEDIYLVKPQENKFISILENFLVANASVLNYDGRQFYAQLHNYLDIRKEELQLITNDSKISEVFNLTKNPPVSSLIPLSNANKVQTNPDGTVYKEKWFDLVTRLNGSERFVVSVSTEKEEICVWDAKK